MRALPLLALALVLPACDNQASSRADAPARADPDVGNGRTIDLDMATGKIPERFHGVWDAADGSCDPASEMRIKVTARRLEYYESIGDVSRISAEGDAVIAELAMTGEGDTWVQPTRLSLETTPDGQGLRISDAKEPESAKAPLRKRCP